MVSSRRNGSAPITSSPDRRVRPASPFRENRRAVRLFKAICGPRFVARIYFSRRLQNTGFAASLPTIRLVLPRGILHGGEHPALPVLLYMEDLEKIRLIRRGIHQVALFIDADILRRYISDPQGLAISLLLQRIQHRGICGVGYAEGNPIGLVLRVVFIVHEGIRLTDALKLRHRVLPIQRRIGIGDGL